MSLDRVPPHHPNPNTGGGSDQGKKKRAREAGREGSTEPYAGAWWSGLHRHVRHRVRRGGRGGDGVLGGDPIGGADLVCEWEACEDDLGDGAGTGPPANQAGHSACLPPLAREEGDDGRETGSPEAFFSLFFLCRGRIIGFGIGREKGAAWESIPARRTRSQGTGAACRGALIGSHGWQRGNIKKNSAPIHCLPFYSF
jgi:hypothetical protein